MPKSDRMLVCKRPCSRQQKFNVLSSNWCRYVRWSVSVFMVVMWCDYCKYACSMHGASCGLAGGAVRYVCELIYIRHLLIDSAITNSRLLSEIVLTFKRAPILPEAYWILCHRVVVSKSIVLHIRFTYWPFRKGVSLLQWCFRFMEKGTKQPGFNKWVHSLITKKEIGSETSSSPESIQHFIEFSLLSLE